jgi:Protein of unknown function (DUF3892)
MAAEGRGTLMHTRVGMLRALNRNVERAFSDRKDPHFGKRKLKRDQWERSAAIKRVGVVQGPNGKYVWTYADGSYNDNLLALPECP